MTEASGTGGERASRLTWARLLDLAVQVPAAVVLLVMVVHVAANALLRTYARAPVTGTLEYTQYWYLPCVVLLGFVAALRRGEHIETSLLYDRLPGRLQRLVARATAALSLLLCAGFTWFSLERAIEAHSIGLTGGTSDVVIWPVVFLVPLAFAAMAAIFAVEVVRGRPSKDHWPPVRPLPQADT